MLLDKPIPFRYILRKIRVELLYILAISLVVYFLTKRFDHLIPEMPITIPGFLGTALSVLLSFKLNQSYDRWWEARKIWGSIVNDSRNLVLQLQAFVQPGYENVVRTIARRQIGWCYGLGASLRKKDPLADVGDYLSYQDKATVISHQNVALAILRLNNDDIAALRKAGALDAFSHVQLNTSVSNLTNYMGMAERIRSTVFPVTYRLFLHMVIYLFIITLSISLREIRSYFEIPLLLVIGALFFLLESTATHLQDPFSDTPTDTAMTTIARTIETNLCQLLGDPVPERPEPPETFYIK